MTRIVIGAVIAAACATVALVVYAAYARLLEPSTPPSPAARHSWYWAAAAPGVNIYIAYRGGPSDDTAIAAWVDRRFSSNLAGINTSRTELRQFDCVRKRSRRWPGTGEFHTLTADERVTVSDEATDWSSARTGTLEERVLLAVCENRNGKSPSSARTR